MHELTMVNIINKYEIYFYHKVAALSSHRTQTDFCLHLNQNCLLNRGIDFNYKYS